MCLDVCVSIRVYLCVYMCTCVYSCVGGRELKTTQGLMYARQALYC